MGRTTMLIFNRASSCLLLLLPLLALLPLSSCSEEASIVQISKEQIKEIGQDVEFNCTTKNAKEYTVLWVKLGNFRSDSTPLSSGTNLMFRDKRFNVTYDEKTSTYTLKIKNVQESDTGTYECQIFVSLDNKPTEKTQLQIRRPPAINTYNTTMSVNVTEFESFQLYCQADGFPVPSVSWKREDDLLLSTGGAIHRDNLLTIPRAQRTDRGVYICLAENGVGSPAKQNASVYIRFAPVITPVRPRVGQALGYDATLECRIEAYPAPKVTWWRNGREIESRSYDDPKRDVFVDATTIHSVGDDDFGEYVCRAENSLGVAQTKLDLIETIVPVCASSCG